MAQAGGRRDALRGAGRAEAVGQVGALTDFECAVLEEILSGDGAALAALREQLTSCRVSGREFTGAGFFTHFSVDPALPAARVKDGDVGLGDVLARVPGLEHGAGFRVVVRDGYLEMLEGYSFGEPWPESVQAHVVQRVEIQLGRFLERRVTLQVVRNSAEARWGSGTSVCFLAWDAAGAEAGEIERIAAGLLDAGAVYFCCWGADCERVHDGIDDVIVARGIEGVLTTWHPEESLAEALEFALTAAYTSEEEDAPVRLIGVGATMGRKLRRALDEVAAG